MKTHSAEGLFNSIFPDPEPFGPSVSDVDSPYGPVANRPFVGF